MRLPAAFGALYAFMQTRRQELSMNYNDKYPPSLPPVTEGPFTLNFARGGGADFAILLSFPEPRGLYYPMASYPKLAEFRAMLESLVPSSPGATWAGQYFFGYVYVPPSQSKTEVSFRARDNGIAVWCSVEEWSAMRTLFQRAWDSPAVKEAWTRWTDRYTKEYGAR